MTFFDWLNNGLLDLSLLGIVVYTLVVTHITIVSVTVYLHRHSAHRALELHPALQHFFRFWLWLTTGMGTKAWTSIHRKHHAVCETEDDPHSPVVQGLRKILFQGAECYREAAAQPEIMEKYGAGCPDDWMERHFYTPHTVLGVTILAFVSIALFGVIGLTVWAMQMIWIPFFAAGVINGVGHYWGYRNFECPDAATNIGPWGILIGGEEMHNNHHTYPNSAKFSQKPWEFDIGWFWIRVFQMLGLARPLSTGPIVEQIPGKTTIDIDTAWAVLNDRFRVMARYAENVVGPLVEQELRKAGSAANKLVRKTKVVLCKEDSLVDDAGKNRISELLEAHPDIRVIYELRQALQAVWSKRGGSADELLAALKQWCHDAEATGFGVLRDFVEELKSYSIPKLSHA
ncbi:MAG: fatty acid desaturase [Gammaproteobacteria bacterium]|nr:fatty acid desaturase [Gammaproteobacteria bacterium]